MHTHSSPRLKPGAFMVILDPILARLHTCWRQLNGPTGDLHRAAILAATDRLLDDWNAYPPRPDSPELARCFDRET